MSNILNIFLLISVLITGFLWFIFKIELINKFFRLKKQKKKIM